MQLFYDANISSDKINHLISAEESKHILRVLRKQIGDHISVTNGVGEAFKTEITGIKSKRCEVNILEHFTESPLPYHLHIAIAPTKSSDRFEFFLEKATEIGITEITPLICDNSERKRLNIKRCKKIMTSAMKQSQRFFLPQLNDLQTYKKWVIQDFKQPIKCIAHCEDAKKNHLKEIIQHQTEILILIGPEGDFSPEEISLALAQKFKEVSLGNKRLRTETAGLTVCQMLSFINF